MIERRSIFASGLVQGVGMRPAVAREARALGITGWVRNARGGTEIEVQGEAEALERFRSRLASALPPPARIDRLSLRSLTPLPGERAFEIGQSDEEGDCRFSAPPDLALCPDCEREFLDPRDRRYHYPFISCGSCGPRYSFIASMPYDRSRSAMSAFPLCDRCRAEYEDPSDRRYHIEGISCPDCGPRVSGLEAGLATLESGGIAAIKGVGGYHLACLAGSDEAVSRLRSRKARPYKPLAVMYPDLERLERATRLSPEERRLLGSSEAPIVLVPKGRFALPPSSLIAPDNPAIGVFLPYSPLHKLVLSALGRPLALTSANLPGDPLVVDDEAAKTAFSSYAAIISHDRQILHRVDDGVAMVAAGRAIPIRMGRGAAPRSLRLGRPSRAPILALGAQLKSTVCVVSGAQLALSPHIGDLEGAAAYGHFERMAMEMLDFYGVEPALVAADLHPGYESTGFGRAFAEARGIPLLQVQHHYAHLLSVLLDSGALDDGDEGPGLRPALGLVLDGTGYGPDGTIWGGELLLARGATEFERLAHLSLLPLPGGEAAILEPWRICAGLGLMREPPPGRTMADLALVERIAADPALSPRSSSCGRLFDAAAAILGFGGAVGFEGEAAMWLEALASEARRPARLPGFDPWDGPALLEMLSELAPDPLGMDRELLAALALGFHVSLAESLAAAAAEEAERRSLRELALSGGVLQNRIFAEAILGALRKLRIPALLPSRVPVNDGGISAGQAAAGILALESGTAP